MSPAQRRAFDALAEARPPLVALYGEDSSEIRVFDTIMVDVVRSPGESA